jgi:hypothetical protein
MEVDQSNTVARASESAAAGGQSLPFVEKYRPKELGEIISHLEIV